MARLNIRSGRVQRLIEERIIPLFLATGSTAALAKLLTDALVGQPGGGVIHPNRVHALLSDDVSRGLNEATLTMIERSADIAIRDPEILPKAAVTTARLGAEAERILHFAGATREEVGRQMALPPAIVATIVPAGQPAAKTDTVNVETESLRNVAGPDWSYQDTAVARCLAAFDARPAARIGLVLPTGAGKTRTALRVVLGHMARQGSNDTPVYWVTHRKNLRTQAHRELQKILSDPAAQLPTDAAALLANRIRFVMVGEVAKLLDPAQPRPTLIVIDEAHHAAAPSYAPIFDSPWPVPVLLLTATPNRGDRLPLGMDEIAFTITYRELAERRAIFTPQFEDFPVDNFDWSETALRDLVDYIVDRSTGEFTKVLVLAPRVDRVEEFYDALVDRLSRESGHPLDVDDVGFVHGMGNSLGTDNETFLARFALKPRAVLISAQILLEGFDDPSINTVVITYPSTSIIRLMQAAGRCVRYAPEKTTAYVVQARNDQVAYHFDHRWLYQEIDDYLRPELLDVDYGSVANLRDEVSALLAAHRVDAAAVERITTRLSTLGAGETCRILFYGLPYYGPREDFGAEARWGAFLETAENSQTFRGLFNGFCALGAELSDPSDYLARDGAPYGIARDLTAGSRWMQYSGLLTAAYFAKREVHGPEPIETGDRRCYRPAGSTTWLKYTTFHFRPALPAVLSGFLADCHNATEIEVRYLDAPTAHASAAKVPLPLGGNEAYLLDDAATRELIAMADSLRVRLIDAAPGDQFAIVAAFLAGAPFATLPHRLRGRLEYLLGDAARAARHLVLHSNSNSDA